MEVEGIRPAVQDPRWWLEGSVVRERTEHRAGVYSAGMRSKLAEQLKKEQRERIARMTPAERLALTERLGEEGLAEYMSANRLDRVAALLAIKRSRRAGRRPSRCLDERR